MTVLTERLRKELETLPVAALVKPLNETLRKELHRSYPNHSWPDDPMEAVPVRGVKRK